MAPSAYELIQGAASTFALMALIFWPLEKVFPARSGQRLLRREWGLDLCFFLGQHLLFGWTSLLLLAWLAAGWTSLVPAATTVLHGLPAAAKVLVAMLLGDLLVYWGHRLQHRVPLLWRFHAVHHSSTTLDWLAAHREHPLDGLYTMTLLNLPIVLLAVPLEAALGLVVFRGLWAVFIHSNASLPLGPLKLLFGAPELHHWHHDAEGTECNFSNLAPWTDLLFGTHYDPGRMPTRLGTAEPLPNDYLGLLRAPFERRVALDSPTLR